MSRLSKIIQSREQWKQKANDRGEKARYLKKENRRLKKERDEHKKAARQARSELDALRRKQPPHPVQHKADLVYIALQLFTVARIGYRAVSRVLRVLSPYLGIPKAPCAQTIVNWVTRLSIVKIEKVSELCTTFAVADKPGNNGFIWMIDLSIGLGAGKILSVLALDVQHHQGRKAPTVQDVHCVAVAVATSWTGELIAAFLAKVMAVTGHPAAFLKDGGTDLGKAARLLSEQGSPSLCIDDLSHKIANLFKQAYGEHPLFDVFLSACGDISKQFKQTVLACLAPPKVSVKARFMNLHRLVAWAEQLLSHSPPGAAAEGSVLAKLRDSLDTLPECKPFINRFVRDARPLLACQKILKTEGLNRKTYRRCTQLIKTIPPRSSVRKGFWQWLQAQFAIAKALKVDKTGLPISTDAIESLFGLGKRHGTGEIKDANRIALRQPALCGQLTKEDARRVLAVSVREQREIEGQVSSLIKQRREVLPNPGTLETLADFSQQNNIELIPGSKT
ncbi:MAG: hypothetical protein P8Y42_18365, partial [Exilibacterium sp.]